MNSLERIQAALRREPLDRVPTFEWLIDRKVIDALTPGGASHAAFCARWTDAVCVDINYSAQKLPDGKIKDEWGMVKEYTTEAHSFPVDGPIKRMEDLEGYTPPRPGGAGTVCGAERRAYKIREGQSGHFAYERRLVAALPDDAF